MRALNALLYVDERPEPEDLRRALRIPALSPGWQASMRALLEASAAGASAAGNAGLVAPHATAGMGRLPRAAGGGEAGRDRRRRLPRARQPTTTRRSHAAAPGQFVTVRLQPPGASEPLVRSYSLSGPPGRCPVSHQREGRAARRSRSGRARRHRGRRPHRRRGTARPVRPRRGSVTVPPGRARQRGRRCDAGARDAARAQRHRDHARRLVGARCPQSGRTRLRRRGRPAPRVAPARPPARLLQRARSRRPARCGLRRGRPRHRRRDRRARRAGGVRLLPVRSHRVHGRRCDPVSLRSAWRPTTCTPSTSVPRPRSRPVSSRSPLDHHITPDGPTGTGARVSFVRSGLQVPWDDRFASLLDFAEACDVPVRWSCRTGVCHTCETGLLDGGVVYDPDPLEAPAVGNVLLCCSDPSVT